MISLAPFKVNGVEKGCLSGRGFNFIKKACCGVKRVNGLAVSCLAQLCALLEFVLVSVGKEPAYLGRQRSWPPVCAHFTPMYEVQQKLHSGC